MIQEDAVDIGLDNVLEASARVDRKGARLEVAFTDESGGAANTINAYLDAHR